MLFEIATRILGRNSKHTANAIISIGLVIAMIISLFGIISGFSSEINSLTSQIGEGKKILIREDVNSLDESYISEKAIKLCKIDNVAYIIPQKFFKVQVELGGGAGSGLAEIPFWGVNKSLFFSVKGAQDLNSNVLKDNTSVVLGEGLFQTLNRSLPLDINVTAQFNHYKIQTTVNETFYGLSNYDMGIIGSETHGNLLNPALAGYYSFIEIIVADSSQISKTAYSLSKILASEGNFQVEIVQKRQEFMLQLFNEIITKFHYFSILIYVIVLLKIFHSVMWIVVKHEYDFVLLRTLGMSKIQISLIILIMTFLLGNLALVCGILLGISFPPFVVGVAVLLLNIRPTLFAIQTDQLISVIIVVNVVYLAGCLWPIYNLSKKKLQEFQALNEL